MIDFIYVLVTVAFFTLMIAYVKACELLGRASPGDAGQPEDTAR